MKLVFTSIERFIKWIIYQFYPENKERDNQKGFWDNVGRKNKTA